MTDTNSGLKPVHTPGLSPWMYSVSTGRVGRDPLGGDFVCTVRASEEKLGDLLAAAPEMLEALKAAEQFIVNGVDLGFIRMPDVDTRDTAHKTLPTIRAAILKATGGAL